MNLQADFALAIGAIIQRRWESTRRRLIGYRQLTAEDLDLPPGSQGDFIRTATSLFRMIEEADGHPGSLVEMAFGRLY
jgi:hypothetical protein